MEINSKNSVLEYIEGDVIFTEQILEGRSIDVCVGAFITNYIPTEQLDDFYNGVANSMEGGEGFFAFLMPHPCFCFAKDFGRAMHYEGIEDYHYFNSRGNHFDAKMETVDGKTLEVGRFHSTLGDHFKGIENAGMAVTRLVEPTITHEMAENNPLMKKLEGEPVYLIIAGVTL